LELGVDTELAENVSGACCFCFTGFGRYHEPHCPKYGVTAETDVELTLTIPKSLAQYNVDLHRFFTAMLVKLDKNSHKQTPVVDDVPRIIERLRSEITEFEEQFAADALDMNTLFELADVANYAFLADVAIQTKIRGGDADGT